MVCTARARSDLYQIDATWMVKFRLRILQNAVCGLSIGAAAFTLSHSSQFVPDGWKGTGAVAYYLPIVISTIIWNTINIVWLGKNRCPLPVKPNAVVHTVLALAFIILGVICTAVVAGARGNLFNDPYDLQTDGAHDVVAANGTTVQVSSQNVASCPAFSDCIAQQQWLDKAYLRSGIALGGCVLVDIAFLLHTGLSIWFTLNAVHGVDPRPRVSRNEAMKKYEEDKSSWPQDDKAVMQSEQSLGNDSWNQSNAALLAPSQTFGIHDAGSQSSISVSGMAVPNSPGLLDSPREHPSPALSSSSHFGPPKGIPGEVSMSPSSLTQLQRMDFPDPVRVESPMRVGDFDRRISPLSYPQRPFSGTSTPNFSLPSSIGGDPQIPMPQQYSFYPQPSHSVSQSSFALSPSLSQQPGSSRPSSARPKTADLGKPENELTALPPAPPLKELRRIQSGWL